MQVQRLSSSFIVGLPSDGKVTCGPKDYGTHERTPLLSGGDIGAVIFSDLKEIDVKFRFGYRLLLEEKEVVKAFQQHGEMFVWTTRRCICGSEEEKQADYRGTIALTRSGLECQRWDSQTPQRHNRTPEIYPYKV